MTMAWVIAALHRQKKLPELKTLLRKRQDKPQTVGQLKAMFHQLSERYGIPLRKAKPRG